VVELADRFNTANGNSLVLPLEYLEVVAEKPQ